MPGNPWGDIRGDNGARGPGYSYWGPGKTPWPGARAKGRGRLGGMNYPVRDLERVARKLGSIREAGNPPDEKEEKWP
jgi:hypothetical protein